MSEIKNEELEKVVGGSIGENGLENSGGFTGFVSMYELHDAKYFGQRFYFVQPQQRTGTLFFFCAEVVNSYEAWNWVGTNCKHDIRVTYGGTMGERVGRQWEVDGEDYAVYKYWCGEPAK